METQSGYNVDYQVGLALGLVHSATIDGQRVDCIYSQPSAEELGFTINAASLMVASTVVQSLKISNQSWVTNIQAPGVDAADSFLVEERRAGSAGKTTLILKRQ